MKLYGLLLSAALIQACGSTPAPVKLPPVELSPEYLQTANNKDLPMIERAAAMEKFCQPIMSESPKHKQNFINDGLTDLRNAATDSTTKELTIVGLVGYCSGAAQKINASR